MKLWIVLFFVIPQITFASNSQELLKKLVEISSGSNDIAGVTQMQNLVSDELKSINFQTELIPSTSNKLGHSTNRSPKR